MFHHNTGDDVRGLIGFHVAGFGSALLGWLVVALTGWVASWYVGPKGRFEVLVVRRDA